MRRKVFDIYRNYGKRAQKQSLE